MDQKVTYGRAVARVFFFVLLLVVMALPPLLSESPGPVFARVRALLNARWWVKWAALAGVFVVGLAIARLLSGTARRAVSTAASRQVALLPIEQAVSASNGGNGLISPSFPIELSFLKGAEKISDYECISLIKYD